MKTISVQEVKEAIQMQLCQPPTLDKKKNPTSGCKGSIASIAIAELEISKNPEKALAAVKAAFPDSKTTMKSIYWYASKMKIGLQNRQKVNLALEQAKALAS